MSPSLLTEVKKLCNELCSTLQIIINLQDDDSDGEDDIFNSDIDNEIEEEDD